MDTPKNAAELRYKELINELLKTMTPMQLIEFGFSLPANYEEDCLLPDREYKEWHTYVVDEIHNLAMEHAQPTSPLYRRLKRSMETK